MNKQKLYRNPGNTSTLWICNKRLKPLFFRKKLIFSSFFCIKTVRTFNIPSKLYFTKKHCVYNLGIKFIMNYM